VGNKEIGVAIDGPSGSGKGTVARGVAERLGYLYVDTGAMYRAVGQVACEQGISLEDAGAVAALAARLRIEFQRAPEGVHVFADSRDITEAIRSPEASQAASRVAVFPEVRRHLVAQQQRIGAAGGIVMEGRDIGTVVFPQAELKVFLDASQQERARRRHLQHIEQGHTTSLEETLREIEVRDRRDSERAASPLVRAPDAVYLDSTALSIEETIDVIVRLAEKKVSESKNSRA
jgi:cytidylate kinase